MKKYSIKFWITFWIISVIFLIGWFFYWETRNKGVGQLESVTDFLPISEEKKEGVKFALALSDEFLEKDGEERVFLILFQNNLEIRPGGGFIGSFGILKINDGAVTSFETHDTGNFDARIPNTIEPPYPMERYLRIKSWKFRDSNYSPDFPTNAKQAEEFYYMGEGGEQFDGIIGITANVMLSMLKATGPIEIEGYPGTYDSENAIIALEHQVEKGYVNQDIKKGDRKAVMNDLAKEIIKRLYDFDNSQRLQLIEILIEDLKQKDIQLYFKNERLQDLVEEFNWGGAVNQEWNKDYLMLVDANLGAYKSDYYVNRSVEYTIDLTKESPEATLKITYDHTAKQKDWMTKDYLSYLRVYLPEKSWISSHKNISEPQFGQDLNKKYFGATVSVPLASSKTIEVDYALPKNISENYDLLIQKQAGLNNIPVKITIKRENQEDEIIETVLNRDFILSEK